MDTLLASMYPMIVGSFADGHPGHEPNSLDPDKIDRREVVFSTRPFGSFADGVPRPLLTGIAVE